MEAPLETTPKKTPGARIDLFPQVALCQAVGCKRDSAPASGTDSQTALNEDLELRAAESAVKEGRVEPLWLEVERDIEKRFAPNLSSVSSASRGEMALRQLLRPGQAAPDQSQTGWLVREYPRNRLEEEIRSGQDAYDKAAVGREAEVEAEIDAEGNVVALRLILHSGSPAFDREAIRAVQQALRARPLYDPESPHGTVLARYVLRGEVAVNLPHITPAAEPNAGSAQGATFTLPGSFDEVTGKVSLAVPSTKRLKTAVHLLSVRRRTPTTPKP
jgi:TonB family protein